MVTLKQALSGKLTKKELLLVPSSFDIIGDKLVFSFFPEELKAKQRIIGETCLQLFKQITSVFKKTKEYSGKFRTSKLTWIAGSRSKETLYKENGVRLLFDIEKVYFSPRLSSERKRIYEQIKAGEDVLCLFSGCGVYPIVILKNTKARFACGIELNPLAHMYAKQNLVLNKIDPKRIDLVNADVRRSLPTIKKKFDRALMPLPKESEHFLEVTLPKVRNGGIVHFYCFGDRKEMESMKQKVREQCLQKKMNVRFLRSVICGQFSPRVHRWCIDFKVTY